MAFEMGLNSYPEDDAIYLQLLDTQYGSGREVDDRRHIDLDQDGNVLGIVFLYVSDGVDLDGLPEELLPEISRLLEPAGVRINTPA